MNGKRDSGEKDMDLFQVIRGRRSVRSFDGRALDKADEHAIMDYAAKQDNPYGIKIEWRLLDAKKDGLASPVIVGTDTFIAGKMKRVPHAEEAFGYEFEKIVLFAQSLGVGTTWIAGTMNRAAFEKAMDLESDEVLPCASPLGYPAKKMSLRETMMRKGIRADSRFDFSDLFFDCSFERPLTADGAGKLSGMLEAVRLAPSAVNKQPWRVVVCPGTVHFYEKHGRGYVSDDGWDIQKIDMGIALCHFMIAAEVCGYEVSLEIKDPGIHSGEDTTYIASCTYREKT
jgi:nitroreductase